MRPSLPGPWIQPRAVEGSAARPTRTSIPACVACAWRHPDAGYFRVGERDPRQRAVLRVGDTVNAKDVGHGDVRLIHRHMRERALSRHVADCPDAGCHAHTYIDRDGTCADVDADRVETDGGEVDLAAGRDEQPLCVQRGAVGEVDAKAGAVVPDAGS